MRRAAARRRPRSTLGDIPGVLRAPYPGFVDPTPGDNVPERGEWIHEIKQDGSPYSAIVTSPNFCGTGGCVRKALLTMLRRVLSHEQWGFCGGQGSSRIVHIGVVHSCNFIFRKNVA